jgi:hypothetical protein
VRLFDLEVEAGGIDRVPGLGRLSGQVLERPLPGVLDPFFFFDL